MESTKRRSRVRWLARALVFCCWPWAGAALTIETASAKSGHAMTRLTLDVDMRDPLVYVVTPTCARKRRHTGAATASCFPVGVKRPVDGSRRNTTIEPER